MGRNQPEILAGRGLTGPPDITAQLLLEPPRPEDTDTRRAGTRPDGLTNRRMRARMSGGVRGGGSTPPPTRLLSSGKFGNAQLQRCGTEAAQARAQDWDGLVLRPAALRA